MWQYNNQGCSDELMHYGKLGMKWGKHRALVNAKKAGKYTSAARQTGSDSKNAIAELNERASSSASKSKSAGLIKGAVFDSHARAQQQEAKKIKTDADMNEGYYNRVAAIKKEKAYKLAAKYGDAATKAKVSSLIKEHSNKPYRDLPLYDGEDPMVKAFKTVAVNSIGAISDAQRNR